MIPAHINVCFRKV